MDRHQAIRCFCRVVETGSFAAAADDLDLSRSVITKYVQYLESWTGTRLLSRTTRSMRLTEAGEHFYRYCQRVLADTAETLSALRDAEGRPTGRLVVSAPMSLTLGFLGRQLHDFREAHPEVELEVRLGDRPVDLVRDGVDVALRGQGELSDSSLVAVPLMMFERAIVASPAYWDRQGRPRHPRELERHECLPYLLGSDAYRWRLFGPDGEHEVRVAGRFRTDNSLFLVDALRRGAGVGLVPLPMLQPHLAEGALEAVLPRWRAEPRSLFALYPSRRYLPARTTALVRFLKTRLADTSTSSTEVPAPVAARLKRAAA